MSATLNSGSEMSRDAKNNTGNASDTSVNKTPSDKNEENENSNRASNVIRVKSAIPRKRQDLLKWYGWGYKDSMFKLGAESAAYFTGDRYLIGGKPLPHLKKWAMDNFKLDPSTPPKIPELPKSYPESRLPENIRQELEKIALVSVEGLDRLIRAHGQTLKDIACVRSNSFPRIPDAVIWPETHEQVVQIVQCASRHRFVIIPFGGGTSVSGAVTCPANERRPILVLDTSQMNSIVWLDKEQLLARVQAGIVGQDLEREMRSRGFTVGHEPDSYEFSTLGGWVATRASGMKKNTYGNIEDLVVQTKVVTARGVIEKSCRVPRLSCGPEWEHVVLGSEGCLGVVTEVTLKIRPLPAVTRYGSLVFPDWDAGFHFEREVARRRLQPSSIRLMDNEQFRFGQALKSESSWGGVILEGLKRLYITRIKGFDPATLCVVTLLMEGSAEDVSAREAVLNEIAARYGGVPAGADNGERGYTLTFVIAYLRGFDPATLCVVTLLMEGSAEDVAARETVLNEIAATYGGVPAGAENGERRYTLTFVIAYLRDVAIEYDVVAESFETSVPWDRALALCRNVKRRVRDECERRRIQHYLISCRLTQTYDAGCCIYFYFAHNTAQCSDPVATYEEIEEAARDEIIASGGSISHHHGVGKLRKKWYTDTVSEPGRLLLLAAKQALDPDNIFALGNMAFEEGETVDSRSVKSKL